jgi:hypothetical protein
MGRVEENCPSARQLIKSVQQSRRDVGHGIVLVLHCRRGDNLTRCISVMRRFASIGFRPRSEFIRYNG